MCLALQGKSYQSENQVKGSKTITSYREGIFLFLHCQDFLSKEKQCAIKTENVPFSPELFALHILGVLYLWLYYYIVKVKKP